MITASGALRSFDKGAEFMGKTLRMKPLHGAHNCDLCIMGRFNLVTTCPSSGPTLSLKQTEEGRGSMELRRQDSSLSRQWGVLQFVSLASLRCLGHVI